MSKNYNGFARKQSEGQLSTSEFTKEKENKVMDEPDDTLIDNTVSHKINRYKHHAHAMLGEILCMSSRTGIYKFMTLGNRSSFDEG